MGNLCCGGDDAVDTGRGTQQRAFQGQGNRLGDAPNAPKSYRPAAPPADMPAPQFDASIDDSERGRIRAERAAAADARLKAAGGGSKKVKKKPDADLKGPNSEPLMRWS